MLDSLPFDALWRDLRARLHRARAAVEDAQRTAERARDDVLRNLDRLRAEAGLPGLESGPVIDVGERPSAVTRVTRALAAVAVLGLAMLALFSFAAFFAELMVALVIATRVLGLRVEPRAAAGG